MKTWILACLLCSTLRAVGANTPCMGVRTSEGLRNLQHGERACAVLRNGEDTSYLGVNFITCSYGYIVVETCPSPLRYDVATDSCNWQQLATCKPREQPTPSSGTNTAYTSEQIPKQTTNEHAPKPTVYEPTPKPSAYEQTPKPLTFEQTPKPTAHVPTAAPSSNVPTPTPPAYEPTPTPAATKEPSRSTSRKPYSPAPPVPSGPCTSSNCRLPECFCYGARPNMSLADTPQFVMLTFDDSITAQLYSSYFRPLLVDNDNKVFNPNGCRVRSAFYVSLDNTNYSLLKNLWSAGHEIASHTIHHSLPLGDTPSDYPAMVDEIDGMRQTVLKVTGEQTLADSIVGFRAPYLRVAGDVQFDVLRDYGFLYDTSVTNVEIAARRSPLWPYTFHYAVGSCVNPPCPTKSYPLWEVPLNAWMGDNGYSCSMIDACIVGDGVTATQKDWYNFYQRNLENYFYPVKVPMPIFTHGSMFLRSIESYPALVAWIKDVLQTRTDVWFVTPKQVLQWMKQPLTNAQMIQQKWGC